MGPKKKKKDSLTQPVEIKYDEKIDDRDVLDLNYQTDINDDFFNESNKIVQFLMEAQRHFEASRIKRYTDIIFNLHHRYIGEVKENEVLRPQISTAENKLRLALELTGSSEEAMTKLKDSLGDAWKESDAATMREQMVQEKLQEVLIKCKGIDEREQEKPDDTAEFGHLAKYKNIILRERDRLSGEVIDLEKRLATNRYYSENLESMIRTYEDAMNKLGTRAKLAENERLNAESKLRNLMKSMEEHKEAHSRTANKLDNATRDLSDATRKLHIRMAEIDRLKVNVDKYRGELNALNKTSHKQEQEIHELNKTVRNNEETIKALRFTDREKSNTIQQLNGKVKKSWEEQNASTLRMYSLNKKMVLANSDIMRLKNNINSLEKDVLEANGRADEMRKDRDSTARDRDVLRSDLVKLNNAMADLKHDMIIKVNTISVLNLDMDKLNVKLDEAYVLKSKAEKERDEMAQEMETLHDRIENYQEQVRLKTHQVNDLSEKLEERRREVHNFKKQLEMVHSEKTAMQRQLDTTTQERDNFRVIQAKSAHQIFQLTNEVSSNEVKINSLNLKMEHLNNNIKELQSEIKNKENLIASLRKDLREMKVKNEMLAKTITNDELKFMKLTHELEEMRKERNLIGLQMVRRNDEIILIKEKLQIAQNALDNGTCQYNQRIEDIRLLKKEISNLHMERDCLKRAIKSTADMRREIVRLQRALNQERVRIRALTEDAKTPTGVHRWRILKGEDPKKFELLEKLQVLQKRTLKLSIVNSNIKTELSETIKTNETLKRMLSHMPTIEVKHKLVVQQRINRQMTKKLKTLAAERSIDEMELHTRQCKIDATEDQLAECQQVARMYLAASGEAIPPIFEIPASTDHCNEHAPFSNADSDLSAVCAPQKKATKKLI